MFSTFTEWVDSLLKAAGHKYIKRVPYMSGGKTRYRYIYHVTHTAGGKHVLDPEHMVQGAAFMLSSAKGSEVHAHITKVDGDMVTYRLDDGPKKGELVTESKSKLAERLNAEHGVHEALAGAREKQAKVVADLKERGASEKHVAREQARLDRLSASAPAPEAKSGEPKKRAPKKPKSVEPAAEGAKSVEPTAKEPKSVEPKSGDEVLDVLLNLDAPENKEVADAIRLVMDDKTITSASVKARIEVEKVAAKPPYSFYDGRVALSKDRGMGLGPNEWAIRLDGRRFVIQGVTLENVIAKIQQTPPPPKSSDPSYSEVAGNASKYIQALVGASVNLAPSISQLKDGYKDALKFIADRAMLRGVSITQQGEQTVQETTGEYTSDAAIPKDLQVALKRFVSKEKTRPSHAKMLKPFHRDGHMYATDGMRAIRVAVQSAPTEEASPNVDRVFANAQGNEPTVTLGKRAAKSIADVCKMLGAGVSVGITTLDGKTTLRAQGETIATVDAHAESAPLQLVDAKYLADMLSVEQPITILQAPDASATSPLSAHTANTQQVLMPLRR